MTALASRVDVRKVYDQAFFAAQIEGASQSASVIVPRIMDLFPKLPSAVDVGCGTGIWLHHFKLAGVPRVLGIDGGDVEEGMLQIAREEFKHADLLCPLPVHDRFDIAISLEVAEHLPPAKAETFVSELCRLSDIVVFSAAIPGQGGTWHINERWPSYWGSLFDSQGFECFDVLRHDIWYDIRVEWWYSQNMLIFGRRSGKSEFLGRLRQSTPANTTTLDSVHPRCFEAYRLSLEATKIELEATKIEVETLKLDRNLWRVRYPFRHILKTIFGGRER